MRFLPFARLLCSLVMTGTVAGMAYAVLQTDGRERMRQLLEVRMRRTKFRFLQYKRIDRYLSRYGAYYMFHAIHPLAYITIKSLVGILALHYVAQRSIILSIPAFLVGFLLPDVLLGMSNKRDNEDMLEDIQKVYDVMRIQSRAGVFLNDALAESYLIIKNRRLKTAVLELVNQIAARSDVEAAIDAFNLKFKCGYVDSLCIVIKQSLQSGKTVQLLTDISSQLTYIRRAISLKEKERIERKIAIVELLIYIVILSVGMYVLSFEFNNMLDM